MRHRAKLPKVGTKVRRDGLRVSVKAGGNHYKQRFLMRRFTHAGIKLYNLTPRRGQRGSGRPFRGSYVEAKIKRRENGAGVRAIGENKPYVWSGETRNRVRSMARVEGKAASATRGHWVIIAQARQLNRAGSGKRINLVEEFERTAPSEEREVERVQAKAYDKHLQRHFARSR